MPRLVVDDAHVVLRLVHAVDAPLHVQIGQADRPLVLFDAEGGAFELTVRRRRDLGALGKQAFRRVRSGHGIGKRRVARTFEQAPARRDGFLPARLFRLHAADSRRDHIEHGVDEIARIARENGAFLALFEAQNVL